MPSATRQTTLNFNQRGSPSNNSEGQSNPDDNPNNDSSNNNSNNNNDDDDDDKSVQTSNLTPKPVTNPLMEKYIKLIISPRNQQELLDVNQNLSQLLIRISESNKRQDLEIWDQNGIRRNAQHWKNLTEFHRQFSVYQSKKPRTHTGQFYPRFWTTIRILTNTSLKTIRGHHQVSSFTKAINANIAYTEWTDSKTDAFIASIGFLLQ